MVNVEQYRNPVPPSQTPLHKLSQYLCVDKDNKMVWRKGKGIANILQSFLSQGNLPSHFHPAFTGKPFSLLLDEQTVRAGRPPMTMDIIVSHRGYCSASRKCCSPTKFVAGLTRTEAKKLYESITDGKTLSTSTMVTVSFRQLEPSPGHNPPGCVHQVGVGYGLLSKDRRIEAGPKQTGSIRFPTTATTMQR